MVFYKLHGRAICTVQQAVYYCTNCYNSTNTSQSRLNIFDCCRSVTVEIKICGNRVIILFTVPVPVPVFVLGQISQYNYCSQFNLITTSGYILLPQGGFWLVLWFYYDNVSTIFAHYHIWVFHKIFDTIVKVFF